MKFELELTEEEEEILRQNDLAREAEEEWEDEETWEEIVRREIRIIEQSNQLWERYNKI